MSTTLPPERGTAAPTPPVRARRYFGKGDAPMERVWFVDLTVRHPDDPNVGARMLLFDRVDNEDPTEAPQGPVDSVSLEAFEDGGGDATIVLPFGQMDWLVTVAYPALRAEAVRLGLWRPLPTRPAEVHES